MTTGVHSSAAHGVAGYLSTACLHGEHAYCRSDTGLSGAKTPTECKFCGAQCTCACRHEPPVPDDEAAAAGVAAGVAP